MTTPDEFRTCPAPEDLGAYFEGTLDTTTRQRISDHVANCDDCLFLLREAGTYERTVTPDLDAPRVISRWQVAAAAALIAVLSVSAVLLMRQRDPMRELLGTVAEGGVRPTQGRLANLTYLPYRAGRSGTEGDAASTAAARGIVADAQPESAAEWHTVGVAHLVLGRHSEAVQSLLRAVQLAPSSLVYRSDLAAARITLANTRRDKQELRLAVEDAEAALRIDRRSAAALFNRAVALDHLGESTRAARAYDDYLAVDPDSPWAAEARWRRDRLTR